MCAQRGFDHAENLRPAASQRKRAGAGAHRRDARAQTTCTELTCKKIVVLAVAKGESRLRPSPAKLGWDPPAVLALARRIRWSICAPHVGQFDVGVTLFLEVPFRQLWCITPLSRKKFPRFDWAPPGVGHHA